MDEKKKIFNLSLSDNMMCIYEDRVEKPSQEDSEFPANNYELEAYSLEEVVLLAKADVIAREEYIMRTSKVVSLYVAHICKEYPYFEPNNVHMAIQRGSLRAMEAFDPEKGVPFINFFRKTLKLHLLGLLKNESVRYYNEVNHLGRRVYFSTLTFADFMTDSDIEVQKGIIEKVDFDEFVNNLAYSQKELIVLFMQGYSFREISDIKHISASTVAYRIYSLLKKFNDRTKK